MLESRNTYDGCMNMEQKDEKPQSNQKPRDQRGPRPWAMDSRGRLARSVEGRPAPCTERLPLAVVDEASAREGKAPQNSE